MPVRSKILSKQKTVISPFSDDPNDPVQFTIKKATNRDDVERSALFSKVRYIQNYSNQDEMISERDVSVGEVQIATIGLCLKGWNLTDDKGRSHEINEENILDLLKAPERRWLFDQVMDFNPMWKGEDENNGEEKDDAGEAVGKSASESSSKSKSATSAKADA